MGSAQQKHLLHAQRLPTQFPELPYIIKATFSDSSFDSKDDDDDNNVYNDNDYIIK